MSVCHMRRVRFSKDLERVRIDQNSSNRSKRDEEIDLEKTFTSTLYTELL